MKLRTLSLIPFLLSPVVQAEGLFELYQPLNSIDGDDSIPLEVGHVQLNQDVAQNLDVGDVVDISLPFQSTVTGTVAQDFTNNSEDPKKIIRLDGGGGVELGFSGEEVSSMRIIPINGDRYYQTEFDSSGQGSVISQDLNIIQCLAYPSPAKLLSNLPDIAEQSLDLPVSELSKLQSRPGASKVLFVNFWGGTESGTIWTDLHNNGNDINYDPYDIDGNNLDFSLYERNAIWLAWAEVAEDYAGLDINITTDIDVYNATSVANRALQAVTTTNYFYTGAGGVAYLFTFDDPTAYAKTSWTWNLYPSSMGMTISHESGHQMGLYHDGGSSSSYYSGHGTWGPIMGAPFGKSHVQFSKGEYVGANNSEDDFVIIQNMVPVASDLAGDTTATAQPLTDLSTEILREITPDGVSGSDIDVYTFNLSSTTNVDLEIYPWIADPTDTNTYGTNLSLEASLKDDLGNVLGIVSPNSDARLNRLSYSGSLSAGDYYITVDALSYDPSWTTGFGEYGNGGKYVLNLEIEGKALPGQVTLISPEGGIQDTSPTFQWQEESNATSYIFNILNTDTQLEVVETEYTTAEVCTAGVCELQSSDINLVVGDRYRWKVKAKNSVGTAPWASTVIRILPPLPAVVVQLAPSGDIQETSPSFVWTDQEHVTTYRVRVYDRTLTSTIHVVNYAAADLCDAGTCSLSNADIELTYGSNHFWRIRAHNDAGWGPWSGIERFNVLPPLPAVPTPISPIGDITTATPNFSWEEENLATVYKVRIYDKTLGSAVLLANFDAVDVCSNGICELVSPVTMSNGNNHFWRIRAKNASGWGAWSSLIKFNY